MNKNDPFHSALEAVIRAREAVIQAQGNANPQDFQQAQQQLFLARELIKDSKAAADTGTPEKQQEYLHAREHLKHLQENLDAIRTT